MKVCSTNLIGEGSYSKVYKNSSKTVIKKYKNLDDGCPADMIKEIAVLQKITSPYIISVLNILEDSIILPLYEDDLSIYFKKGNKIEIPQFMFTIFNAVYHLHSSGICHRDIKPSNILVRDSKSGVLIDFGFSKTLDLDRRFGRKTPNIITNWYRPPEVIDENRDYSFEVDVWSLGCILAELYQEAHLFNYKTDIQILKAQCYLMGTPQNYFQNIKVPEYKGVFKENFALYGDEVCELLSGMLSINHMERWDITQCLNSKYFGRHQYKNVKNNYIEYLEKYHFQIGQIPESILKMRQILVLWMLECCTSYNLSDTTYFRSVIILDEFISNNKTIAITKDNFQLVGMASLWIGSKVETQYNISLENLIYISDDSFSKQQLIDMEKAVLKEINYNTFNPVLINYISMFKEEFSLDKTQIYKMNKYLHLCSIFVENYKYPFFKIAGICARLSCGKVLVAEDRYTEEDEELLICQEQILKCVHKTFELVEEKFCKK